MSELRADDGSTLPLDVGRWLAPATDVDERVLERAVAPVLDVGCGPARHVVALNRSGVVALGVDVAPHAVGLARARGALVLERSIFGRVPGMGRWGSALLLDGNVGIGGDPGALLRRLAALLRTGGRVLVELDRPGCGLRARRVRLEHEGAKSPWFSWATVGADAIAAPAAASGFHVRAIWADGGRWFARLDRQ